MNNSPVEKYLEFRDKLDSLHIRGIEDYNISSAIAIQIWKAVTMKKQDIILRTLGLLINEKIEIQEEIDIYSKKTALLYVEQVPMRDDNIQIFDNAVSFLEPCNHIVFTLIGIISLKWLFRKIPYFFRSLVKLTNIPIIERMYFAASIAVVYEVVCKCNKSNIMKETCELLLFQDHEMMQNIAVQYVHNQNGIAISMQHGQRVFRKVDADYLAFDNFVSDYTLLWNKFSQEQYIKAGYNMSRLPIVGSTKYVNTDIENTINSKRQYKGEKGVAIGVVLNAPSQLGTDEIATRLLNWANIIRNKIGGRVIVKIHPTDDINKYTNFIKMGIQFVDPSMSMYDFSELINLGIGHASGALVDLIIMKVPVFQYENEIAFPLDLPKIYRFKNYQEMEKCVVYTFREIINGDIPFSEVREKYYEENAVEKHELFFKQIGQII